METNVNTLDIEAWKPVPVYLVTKYKPKGGADSANLAAWRKKFLKISEEKNYLKFLVDKRDELC